MFFHKKNIKYKWVKVGLIKLESKIVCISWNNDGSRLLVACDQGTIQMWHYNPNSWSVKVSPPTPPHSFKKETGDVRFSVFDENTESNSDPFVKPDDSSQFMFRKVWQTT